MRIGIHSIYTVCITIPATSYHARNAIPCASTGATIRATWRREARARRYGVAPDHQDVKKLTERFAYFANEPRVTFFGNVEIGGGGVLVAIAGPSGEAFVDLIDSRQACLGSGQFRVGLPTAGGLEPPPPLRTGVRWLRRHTMRDCPDRTCPHRRGMPVASPSTYPARAYSTADCFGW